MCISARFAAFDFGRWQAHLLTDALEPTLAVRMPSLRL
jgi:hypothetical protein